MITNHAVVEWGQIEAPNYVRYFHQLLKENQGTTYYPAGGSIELSMCDELLYPNLKEVKKIFMIYTPEGA